MNSVDNGPRTSTLSLPATIPVLEGHHSSFHTEDVVNGFKGVGQLDIAQSLFNFGEPLAVHSSSCISGYSTWKPQHRVFGMLAVHGNH